MISFFRSVVVLVTMLWWCLAWAQTDYTFNCGYSTRETAQKAHDDADLNRAVQAYRVLLPDRLMRGPLDRKSSASSSTGCLGRSILTERLKARHALE